MRSNVPPLNGVSAGRSSPPCAIAIPAPHAPRRCHYFQPPQPVLCTLAPHSPSPDLTSGWASALPLASCQAAPLLPRRALPRGSSCQPPPRWQASPGRQPAGPAPAAAPALPSPAARAGGWGWGRQCQLPSSKQSPADLLPRTGLGPRTLLPAPAAPCGSRSPASASRVRPLCSLRISGRTSVGAGLALGPSHWFLNASLSHKFARSPFPPGQVLSAAC